MTLIPDKDHPRSRGVYWEPSPPVIWTPWIIPARAGFTCVIPGRIWRGTDHPRSRGVYAPSEVSMEMRIGSSPLARGLHEPWRRGPRRGRIIPARAGFTITHPKPCNSNPDHPRSRGVYSRG